MKNTKLFSHALAFLIMWSALGSVPASAGELNPVATKVAGASKKKKMKKKAKRAIASVKKKKKHGPKKHKKKRHHV
jgi:hypothetical protein